MVQVRVRGKVLLHGDKKAFVLRVREVAGYFREAPAARDASRQEVVKEREIGGSMDSMITWFLGFTKLGAVVDWLDGKKQMFASLAAALAATATMAAKFSDQGHVYLFHVASTPEFAAASVGWIGFFNALHGKKVMKEIAAGQAEKMPGGQRTGDPPAAA